MMSVSLRASTVTALVTNEHNHFRCHERLLDAHSGWTIVDDNRLPRPN